ncbi:MAG: ROK family protein [bacterium]
MKYAFGIDIGGTNTRVGLVDETGNIITLERFPTEIENPSETFLRLSNWINNIRVNYKEIEGIGVGCAGVVRVSDGVLLFSPNLPLWRNIQIKLSLESLTGIPVVVDNDANLFALGESIYGAGKGKSVVIGITIGTGIGGGIIHNGRVFHGTFGGAGELGHVTIVPYGPRCNCGNFGCVEAFAGSYGIERRANEIFLRYGRKFNDRLTPELIGKLAKENDELATMVINETAYYLGIFLVSIVHIFNPDVIVIGGGISNWDDYLFVPLRKFVFDKAMKHLTQSLSIEKGALGDYATLIGASSIFFQ